MSPASLRSPGSRRALIAVIAVVIAAAAGAFFISRPSASVAPAASTAGPQDIVARGRIEPLGRVIAVNAPADTPVTVLQKLLVHQGSKVQAGQELALADDYDVRKSDLAVQKQSLTLAESQLAQVQAGAKSAELAA
jgi:HlyD family secretion protein